MKQIFEKLTDRVQELKDAARDELRKGREKFSYVVRGRKVTFEADAVKAQRKWKTGLIVFFREANLGHVATIPLIFMVAIPFALLDLFATVYMRICFPVYKVPVVRRSDYVVIDRHKLAYLNMFEKLNCVYCGYATGVLTYVGEITSRTEYFWCPIKHAREVKVGHDRYYDFLEYGDSENYRERFFQKREKCRACESCGAEKTDGEDCSTDS